jgi:hypothetical protein
MKKLHLWWLMRQLSRPDTPFWKALSCICSAPHWSPSSGTIIAMYYVLPARPLATSPACAMVHLIEPSSDRWCEIFLQSFRPAGPTVVLGACIMCFHSFRCLDCTLWPWFLHNTHTTHQYEKINEFLPSIDCIMETICNNLLSLTWTVNRRYPMIKDKHRSDTLVIS